jgi:2-polyprenyl-3-methyl-5-hydroxy-6-metoxy-1,4-benzoquinol methylase
LLDTLASPLAVAIDLSEHILRQRQLHSPRCLAAAGEELPFRSGCFDAVFHINLLEHVISPEAVISECARVLRRGGLLLGITPNGSWEFWLDLAERLKLKIPEGPHVFLEPDRLKSIVRERFQVLEHRTFLVLPVGPRVLARFMDRITLCASAEWGFFQCIVGRRD